MRGVKPVAILFSRYNHPNKGVFQQVPSLVYAVSGLEVKATMVAGNVLVAGEAAVRAEARMQADDCIVEHSPGTVKPWL